MAKALKDRLSVSIDIGTTKICVLVAEQVAADHVEVLGIGKVPSEGLQKGVVVHVPKTIQSIKAAVKEASLMSGIQIDSAAIGISGAHIRSMSSHAIVLIKNGQVRSCDIASVLDAAKAIAIPEGYQILHILPQYFIIDGQELLQNPLGMCGIRLEVKAHVVLGAIASVQNLITCCEFAGVKVTDIVLEPIASAQAVLSEDERQLGVAMLDIGGGTSDLVIYQNNSIVHTMILPIAGRHFTNDIAIGLRASLKDAERVKLAHGTLLFDSEDEKIEIERAQGFSKMSVSKRLLTTILYARAQEMLELAYKEIEDKQLRSYCASGLVITGGGSQLHGIDAVAQAIFNMPVRIGKLHSSFVLPTTMDSPIYATGYGLLLNSLHTKQLLHNAYLDGQFVQRVASRMKSWVTGFF